VARFAQLGGWVVPPPQSFIVVVVILPMASATVGAAGLAVWVAGLCSQP